MNNEETKVLNQSEETVVMNNTTEKREDTVVENTATETAKKKSVINDKAAYAAGGFAAGLASGVAGSAFAASPDKPVDVTEEVVVAPENSEEVIAETVAVEEPVVTADLVVTAEPIATQAVVTEEPIYAAPDPEDVLVATDEGVRIAQVDDDASFAEAFADARAQVGPGGAFEWRGHVYNTYYEEEWNSMSADERAEYQQKIDYETITGDNVDTVASAPVVEEAPQVEPVMASDTEMVETEGEVEGVKVLGVEAVVDEYGNEMVIAGIEVDGEQALLVDVDNDGMMDAIMIDENGDNMIDFETEVYDASDLQISTDDLMQQMAVQDNDMYLAYNDDMPDYMNDADVSAMA